MAEIVRTKKQLEKLIITAKQLEFWDDVDFFTAELAKLNRADLA